MPSIAVAAHELKAPLALIRQMSLLIEDGQLSPAEAQQMQRRLTLARELTKTFETFLCGTVSDIQTALADDGNQARGEMVLILHPAVREKNAGLSEESLRVMKILSARLPTKQAAALAAEICGENKKALYDAALAWK